MSYALQATTPAGKKFQAAAVAICADLRARAGSADKEGLVCADNFRDLATNGIAAAFVPEACGGWGLESVHDWIAGLSALGRGDGSTAIAINMHLSISRGMAAAYGAAESAGKDTTGIARPLKAIAGGKMLVCATATERGTDNLHPLTEAVASEDGWVINGTKMFVTLSPLATHLGMNLRMRDAEGDHLVTTLLPMNTPGIIPQDDWDSLGMRASGSQSIKFENVAVPRSALRRLGPWGEWSTAVIINRTVGNLTLVAAFLGIAEHAREIALNYVQGAKRLGQPIVSNAGVQHLVGEMEIELAKCQAILSRAATGVDEFLASHARNPASNETAHELLKDYQSAKWVVNRGAIDIVSKAMDLCGGAGFGNGTPLARLYRDVRAGPFMQPFAATELREYVGKVTLGITR